MFVDIVNYILMDNIIHWCVFCHPMSKCLAHCHLNNFSCYVSDKWLDLLIDRGTMSIFPQTA